MMPAWPSGLVALAAAAQLAASAGTPRHDFHQPVPPKAERLKGPARRYADLSPEQCKKQLRAAGELGKAFKLQGPAHGIAAPLRVVGPLGDVTFKVPPPKLPWGILDCRQALVWIEILPVLQAHEVATVRIDNFYRNGSRIGRGKKSQHAYGLAADIMSITFRDGQEVVVLDDFYGKLGEPVCGPNAAIHPPPEATKEEIEGAIRVRNLVCDLAGRGAFNGMLTPNFNQAHQNHFHFDIKRDSSWYTIE